MLILRGIAGRFGGVLYPQGALDEPSALAYADARGYAGRVLDEKGDAYYGSPQHLNALIAFRADASISAFLGFSGGGYNLHHILDDLTEAEKKRVKLVVVLGAPGTPQTNYLGDWELVYCDDPGHMDGPAALLGHFLAGMG